MSRVAPATVSPIEFEGLRYAQIINGSREGLDQRTGFLAITEIATGQRIAAVKVYPGKDGDFALYDDDGASHDYGKGKGTGTVTQLHWSDATATLSGDKTLASKVQMVGK